MIQPPDEPLDQVIAELDDYRAEQGEQAEALRRAVHWICYLAQEKYPDLELDVYVQPGVIAQGQGRSDQ